MGKISTRGRARNVSFLISARSFGFARFALFCVWVRRYILKDREEIDWERGLNFSFWCLIRFATDWLSDWSLSYTTYKSNLSLWRTAEWKYSINTFKLRVVLIKQNLCETFACIMWGVKKFIVSTRTLQNFYRKLNRFVNYNSLHYTVRLWLNFEISNILLKMWI